MLTAAQLRDFRAFYARGYRFPPSPCRVVMLHGAPLDGIRVQTGTTGRTGAISAFIFHHGAGHVFADYTLDIDGAWRFRGWSDGSGRPANHAGRT